MNFDKVTLRDPEVGDIESASLLVPEGWNHSARYEWSWLFSKQVNLQLRVDDPQNEATMFLLPTQRFVWMPSMSHVQPGSNWLGQIALPLPNQPTDVMQWYLLQNGLQHLQNSRLVRIDDVAGPAAAAASMLASVGIQKNVWMSRLRHAYEWGGRGWEEDVYFSIMAEPPNPTITNWSLQTAYALRAPAGELDRVTPMLFVPLLSMRTTLGWSTMVSHAELLYAENIRDQQKKPRPGGQIFTIHPNLTKIWFERGEELSKSYRPKWQLWQRHLDSQIHALSQFVGGLETLVNPFDSYALSLPTGAGDYWVNDAGRIVGSDDRQFDPRTSGDGEWRRMERYAPAPQPNW